MTTHHAELASARRAIRTPRAAAIAGIAFALLDGTAVVLLQISIGGDPDGGGSWISDDGRRNSLELAVRLLPFAGIAFLWFIGVVRDRVGDREDRFFSTVFLGSGLLFVAMLFASGAATAAAVASVEDAPAGEPGAGWTYERRLALDLWSVYGVRMAAVFTLTTTNLAMRIGLVPRWLTVWGLVTTVLLLLGVGRWVGLAFPLWVLLLSLHILAVSLRGAPDPQPA